jgi:hypothetical protein
MYDNHAIFRPYACTETFAFCKLGVEEHTWGTWHCVLIITPSTLIPCSAAFMYEYVLYHTASKVSVSAELLFFITQGEISWHLLYPSCKQNVRFRFYRKGFLPYSLPCAAERSWIYLGYKGDICITVAECKESIYKVRCRKKIAFPARCVIWSKIAVFLRMNTLLCFFKRLICVNIGVSHQFTFDKCKICYSVQMQYM